MAVRWVLLHDSEAMLVEEGEVVFGLDPVAAICTRPRRTSCPWSTLQDEAMIAFFEVESLDEVELKLDQEYERAKAGIAAARGLLEP